MTRAELQELGYIVPIASVPSIFKHGILSHKRAEKVTHTSIALQYVQDIRANKIVPNGRPLHEYVNLYFSPRNPMMSKKRSIHEEICVLRVESAVIDIPNAVVTDSNAGSKYVTFKPASDGLDIVNRARTFARSWKNPEDQIDEWRHSAQKCAEVLVPDVVPSKFIFGAYVSCEVSRKRLQELVPSLQVTINADLFFQ